MADNGTARLDRIERALELMIADYEVFRDEHKRLLTKQVVLQDALERLTAHDAAQDKRIEAHDRELEEHRRSMRALNERMDAMISALGDSLRKRPAVN